MVLNFYISPALIILTKPKETLRIYEQIYEQGKKMNFIVAFV